MTIAWDPSLAVGVKLIDQQHQHLFMHVDALIQAMMKGKGKTEVEPLIIFLADYVRDHFGAEEHLMERHAYPGMADHKRQHAGFIETFSSARAEVERYGPSPNLAVSLNNFLSRWLRDHIGRVDMALGKFLAGRPPDAQR